MPAAALRRLPPWLRTTLADYRWVAEPLPDALRRKVRHALDADPAGAGVRVRWVLHEAIAQRVGAVLSRARLCAHTIALQAVPGAPAGPDDAGGPGVLRVHWLGGPRAATVRRRLVADGAPADRLRVHRLAYLYPATAAVDAAWLRWWRRQPDAFYAAAVGARAHHPPEEWALSAGPIDSPVLTAGGEALRTWTERICAAAAEPTVDRAALPVIPDLTLGDLETWLLHPAPEVREAVQLHVLPGVPVP